MIDAEPLEPYTLEHIVGLAVVVVNLGWVE